MSCACGADSVCVSGAWLRCVVGCWAVSDMAGCGGWAWIWLLVVLVKDKMTFIYNRLKTFLKSKQLQISSLQLRSVLFLLGVVLIVLTSKQEDNKIISTIILAFIV